MIAIIDYGVGNLFSLTSSFKAVAASEADLGEITVTGNPEIISRADKIILPGVGAFGDAADKLKKNGLDEVIKERTAAGVPLLGICLGMQLLFDKSFEYGEHKGLGLISGEIRPIEEACGKELKVPHIGWNALHFKEPKSKLFKYLEEGECVYFVHSYYASNCGESVTATTEYGAEITAAAECGNVYGCQFHPEKSGATGLKILKAFCEL